MNKIKQLQKPLPLDWVDLRIGSVKENKGFSLLAYKDSRADVKRFNEVFGLRWKPEYSYDSNGILKCKISVYDDDIGQWIGREDVGVESYTEKEKGSYSDALKRAGFRWGVGIELYDMPFIWIQWTKWYGKRPSARPTDWRLCQGEGGYYIEDKYGKIMWSENNQQPKKTKLSKKPKQNNNVEDKKKYFNKIRNMSFFKDDLGSSLYQFGNTLGETTKDKRSTEFTKKELVNLVDNGKFVYNLLKDIEMLTKKDKDNKYLDRNTLLESMNGLAGTANKKITEMSMGNFKRLNKAIESVKEALEE